MDLSDLLAANLQLQQKDSEPHLLFDGHLVLTSQPKKQRGKIEDIAAWLHHILSSAGIHGNFSSQKVVQKFFSKNGPMFAECPSK